MYSRMGVGMVEKQMRVINILIALTIGILIGICWSYYNYQPLKLTQEIQELQADVDNCERRWSRDFSKKHGLIE